MLSSEQAVRYVLVTRHNWASVQGRDSANAHWQCAVRRRSERESITSNSMNRNARKDAEGNVTEEENDSSNKSGNAYNMCFTAQDM